MNQEIHNSIETSVLEIPATKTGSFNSSSEDVAGKEASEFVVIYGNSGDTLSGSIYWQCTLEDSPDDSTFTAVAAANMVPNSTATFGLVNTGSEDSTEYRVGYIGKKRYVRVVVTATGTHTYGTPICVFYIGGHLRKSPPTSIPVNP